MTLVGLGIGFLEFVGIYFPWTQTWAAKQKLFLFSEVFGDLMANSKINTFFCCFLKAPDVEFCFLPSSPPYVILSRKKCRATKVHFCPRKNRRQFSPAKNGQSVAKQTTSSFPFVDLEVPFFGWNHFIFANHFRSTGPHTNPKPKSAANKKSQLRSRKNPKIQETYASKLKQMKAMHSELQTYQSQASLFVSRRFFRCVWWKRVFFLWGGLVKRKGCRCGDRCGVV